MLRFLFQEKATLPHIRRDMIDFYRIPICEINNIKNGMDWTTEDGTLVPSHRLTEPSDPPRSFAYCSDTCYLPELAQYIQKADLLFHEATFSHDDLARAKETFHTTALLRQPHSHGTAKSKSSVSVIFRHGMKTKANS